MLQVTPDRSCSTGLMLMVNAVLLRGAPVLQPPTASALLSLLLGAESGAWEMSATAPPPSDSAGMMVTVADPAGAAHTS